MKMKSLVVIALLVLGCIFTSAQTFGFQSAGGDLYCNYEVLQQLAPYAVWQGVDNLSMCTGRGGSTGNATLVGISGGLTKAQNPGNFSVKGVVFADNIYDAFSGSYDNSQYFVVSALKCSEKKFGWIALTTMSGILFSDNYGYLSCQIPGRDGAIATRGPSTGRYTKALGGEESRRRIQ